MNYTEIIDATNAKNMFMTHNSIKLTHMEADHAVVELEIRPESRNLYGSVHGGVFLTMADCAAGSAARSRGMRYVTVSNSFEFFRNTKSDMVRAYASVKNRGKTMCAITVDVKDGENKLLASGTFTMYCTGVLDHGA